MSSDQFEAKHQTPPDNFDRRAPLNDLFKICVLQFRKNFFHGAVGFQHRVPIGKLIWRCALFTKFIRLSLGHHHQGNTLNAPSLAVEKLNRRSAWPIVIEVRSQKCCKSQLSFSIHGCRFLFSLLLFLLLF